MRRNEYLIITFAFLSLFLLNQCTSKVSETVIGNTPVTDVPTRATQAIAYKTCGDPLSYAPYDHLLHPMRTIRVNVHFMNDSSKKYNFNGDDGKNYMWLLIKLANEKLTRNAKMNLPVGNDTPALSPQYRYEVRKIEGHSDGYFYHYDDELAFFVNKGRNKNNYNRDVIKKYAIGADSILNLFIMPHHPDSLATGRYKPTSTGIALGTSLKVAGLCENREEPWKFSPLLNHEIGHIFGLRHAWYKSDGCEDTPVHPNCWQPSSKSGCEVASNNMMDYNNSQMAITPCQLGIVHKSFADLDSELRGLVVKNWCKLDTSETIRITGNDVWEGALDLSYNVVVEKGASLEIRCRVSMPKGSSITVKEGGKLILDHCRLHSDCGKSWEGIKLQHSKQDSAYIEYIGESIIEDVL